MFDLVERQAGGAGVRVDEPQFVHALQTENLANVLDFHELVSNRPAGRRGQVVHQGSKLAVELVGAHLLEIENKNF